MKNLFQHSLFGLIMLVLILPFFQLVFPFVIEEELFGEYEPKQDIKFSLENWYEGNYQQIKSEYLNDNMGFRKSLVRLNNQIDYSFFNKANGHSVLVGRNNILYQKNYLDAYLGLDYIGRNAIGVKVKKLKVIQDSLAAKGKLLLTVFAPGKASFYSKSFPTIYDGIDKKTSNYEHFKASFEAYEINHIDFNDWFIKMKDTSKYPLFPNAGIHWTCYGEMLAMDSLINRIEWELKRDIPNFHFYHPRITSKAEYTDQDIENLMNLIFDIEDYEMAYPEFHFDNGDSLFKPKFMLVGDSYFNNFYNTGVTNAIFDSGSFWYYNSRIFTYKNLEKSVYEIDFLEEVESNDVIVIMYTDANLSGLGTEFIERLHQAYTNPDEFNFQYEILKIKHSIYQNEEWLNSIIKKANENNVAIDLQIFYDAEFFAKLKQSKTKSIN